MENLDKITKLTPEVVAMGKTDTTINTQEYNIPLYQRLFEWEKDQILQLMHDLHQAFIKHDGKPYYVGMLTAIERDKKLDLVDGQQRFTVMTLLGIYFGWYKFISIGDFPRLRFAARDTDESYLKFRIKNEWNEPLPEDVVKNEKMENGLSYIHSYVMAKTDEAKKNGLTFEIQEFGDYIYRNLTFFLSVLPDGYTMTELNTYFERMNTTGKALEAHEIIKVELLNKIEDNKRDAYTELWNACSQMDRIILSVNGSNEDENEGTYDACRGRFRSAILKTNREDYSPNLSADGVKTDNDSQEEILIRNIEAKGLSNDFKDPNLRVKRNSSEIHAMLTFPEFLLQILFIHIGCIGENGMPTVLPKDKSGKDVNINDFFSVHNLHDTFKRYGDKLNSAKDVEVFFNILYRYRLVMDFFLCRVSDNDEEPYPFKLYVGDKKKEIQQYETMLYAASSAMTYYYWVAPLLVWLYKKVVECDNIKINEDLILGQMKQLDQNWHPNPFIGRSDDEVKESLRYTSIDRYYFWRIDYYLWKHRDKIFTKKKQEELASDYVFRRNRSIEHIAPQHCGDDKNKFNWEEMKANNDQKHRLKDNIGNLCMISSGQNSSLKDSTFEVKRGHIESYINDSYKGHVESLKMLYVYDHYPAWTLENIEKHSDETIQWLKESYEK